MEFNFKKSAEKATTISHLMEGREKVVTEDIIAQFKDGVTIINFDVVAGKDRYPVIVFKELENAFYCGGMVLMKIVDGWLKEFNGDIDKANKELEKFGGVRVKLETSKTKGNNNITKVTVL